MVRGRRASRRSSCSTARTFQPRSLGSLKVKRKRHRHRQRRRRAPRIYGAFGTAFEVRDTRLELVTSRMSTTAKLGPYIAICRQNMRLPTGPHAWICGFRGALGHEVGRRGLNPPTADRRPQFARTERDLAHHRSDDPRVRYPHRGLSEVGTRR